MVSWQEPMVKLAPRLRSMGYEGIESFGLSELLAEDRKLKELLAEIEMTYVGTFIGGSFVQKERWAWEREEFLKSARETALLGGKLMVVGGGRIFADKKEEHWRHLIEHAHEMADLLKPLGLQLVWHPHHETLVFRWEDVLRFEAETDPARVFFAIDSAHSHIGGVEQEKLAAYYRHFGTRLAHVHFKDVEGEDSFVPLGQGKLPFAEIVAELRAMGYDKWITVELDAAAEPDVCARESFDFLSGLLEPFFANSLH